MTGNNPTNSHDVSGPLKVTHDESGRVIPVDENKIERNLWGEVITPKLETLAVRCNPTKEFSLNFGQGYVFHGVVTGPTLEGVDAIQKQIREVLQESYRGVAVENANLASVDWTEG